MRTVPRLIVLLSFCLFPVIVVGSEKQAGRESESSESVRQWVADRDREVQDELIAPRHFGFGLWQSIPVPGGGRSLAQGVARVLPFEQAVASAAIEPPLVRPLERTSVVSPIPPPVQLDGTEYPTYEIAAGYVFLRDLDSEINFPFGWSASVAKNLRPSLGLVGEVSGSYKSESGVTLDLYSFLGGVRFSRRGGSVTPHVGILGGLARSSASFNLFGVGIGASSTDPSFQVGGGIDVAVADRLAMRAEADYQAIFSDGTANLVRLQGGIVYRVGGTSTGTTPSPLQPAGPSYSERGAPRFQLSGEYVFLRDTDLDANFPFGWNFTFARNFSSSLGLVGEVGASYKSELGADLTVWDFLGGLRFSRRGDGPVTPYVEALGGLARATLSVGALSLSGNDPAFQGGGGVDLRIRENLAARVGVDYRAIFGDETVQELRVRAGVVFGFGGNTNGSFTIEPSPPSPSQERPLPEPPPPPTRPIEPAPPPVAEPPSPPPPRPAPEPPPPPPAPAPAPETAFDRAQVLLRSGDFEGAARYFLDYLRGEASDRFTLAIGLFCNPNNVAAHVVNSGYAPELILLRFPRRGPSCFGFYWGLFDSRQQAQQAIDTLPVAVRSFSGRVVVPVSRLIR